MCNHISLALFLPLAPVFCNAQEASNSAKSPAGVDQRYALLTDVITEVETALDAYRQLPEVAKTHTLPDLLTADFDFKTVTDIKEGIGISFLIFKIGYTNDKQTINDVDFQYQPKSQVPGAGHGIRKPQAVTLQKELMDTLKAAGNAIETQRTKPSISNDPLIFKQATITISFGVTKDVTAGATGGTTLVTLTGSLEGSKNAVQQVKLSFAPPPTKTHAALKGIIKN